MIRAAQVLILVVLPGACGSVAVVDRDRDGRAILVRSGQPTAQTLERLRAQHGIRTVVNLRGEHPGKAWWEEERRGVAAIGAEWVQWPTGGRERPPPETVAAFLDLIEDPGARPVLVHCESGIHRTGMLVAVYRMQYQQWSAERALAELRRQGFRLGGRDRSALEQYLREYRPDPSRRLR